MVSRTGPTEAGANGREGHLTWKSYFGISDAQIFDDKLNPALNANVQGYERVKIFIKAREALYKKAY